MLFSPPHEISIPSSSMGNSLALGGAESDGPSRALSPPAMEDTEVLSQRIPEKGVVLEMPQGEIPDAGNMQGKILIDYADGIPSKLGSQPNTALEPPKVPNSGRQPLVKDG